MKIVISIMLAILLFSCSGVLNSNSIEYESPMLSLEEAWARTASFTYMKEIDTWDYWKSPTEFERDGGGDCEDFATYMIYLLGPDAKMAVLSLEKGFHAVVWFEDKLLEPQHVNCYWAGSGVHWLLGYDYVMRRATSAGSKSILWEDDMPILEL